MYIIIRVPWGTKLFARFSAPRPPDTFLMIKVSMWEYHVRVSTQLIQLQGIYRFSPFPENGRQLLYQSHALGERVYNGNL